MSHRHAGADAGFLALRFAVQQTVRQDLISRRRAGSGAGAAADQAHADPHPLRAECSPIRSVIRSTMPRATACSSRTQIDERAQFLFQRRHVELSPTSLRRLCNRGSGLEFPPTPRRPLRAGPSGTHTTSIESDHQWTTPRAPPCPHRIGACVDGWCRLALNQAYPTGAARHGSGAGDVVCVPGAAAKWSPWVWAENSNPDPRLHNRLKDVGEKLDVPPLKEKLRSLVDWVANYTLSARGMVLRMTLRMGEHLGPERCGSACA